MIGAGATIITRRAGHRHRSRRAHRRGSGDPTDLPAEARATGVPAKAKARLSGSRLASGQALGS